jgi:hypothetical protein
MAQKKLQQIRLLKDRFLSNKMRMEFNTKIVVVSTAYIGYLLSNLGSSKEGSDLKVSTAYIGYLLSNIPEPILRANREVSTAYIGYLLSNSTSIDEEFAWQSFNRLHWLPTIKLISFPKKLRRRFQPPTLATYYQTPRCSLTQLVALSFNRLHWLPTIKHLSVDLEFGEDEFQPPTLATYYQTFLTKRNRSLTIVSTAYIGYLLSNLRQV